MSESSNGQYSRSSTKKRSPGNSIVHVYSMSINENLNPGDLNTRIGAEGTTVGQCDIKDTSASDMGGVEVGCPSPSSLGAGLREEPEDLNEKGQVDSSSRMSHASSPSTSSISSYLCSTLSQLPSHFNNNGKSRNRNVMARGVSFLSFYVFTEYLCNAKPLCRYVSVFVCFGFIPEVGMA